MQDHALIREVLLRSRKAAQEHMDQIKGAAPLTRGLLREELSRYILSKYMLDGVDCGTENFNALTELSLSRSMKVSKELVKEFDLAKSCDGATSAMAKKVLLFLNIQRELGLEIPAEESAKDITLTQLADLIWEVMKTNANWKNRLAT